MQRGEKMKEKKAIMRAAKDFEAAVNDQHRLIITLPTALYEQLRRKAFAERKSLAALTRHALEVYLTVNYGVLPLPQPRK